MTNAEMAALLEDLAPHGGEKMAASLRARDARIAELEAVLRVAKKWMKNAASDDVMAVITAALKEAK